MTMTTSTDGLDGDADELVLKDEVSGSDESDSSSVQILDDDDNGSNSAAANNKTNDSSRARRRRCAAPRLSGAAANVSLEAGELPGDSFVVDTEAVEDEAANSAYQRVDPGSSSSHFLFSQVISHHAPVPTEKKRTTGKTCFNCGEVGHELSRCPEPRDARRISQNRNNFTRRSGGAVSRFHEQPQGPQPGVVSDTLRNALGIGPHDLPPWVYRMRKRGPLEGYPPAYRKRATERLTVKFHTEEDVNSTVGNRRRKRKHAETTGEDNHCQINADKLIRFPGYNFDDGTYVDHDTHSWLIPPWDTFVQAQQHHVETTRRRHQRRADDEPPEATKRNKMKEGNSSGDDAANDDRDNDDDDVLFVDASRQGKKRKANNTLEEGEIVEDDEETGEIVEEEEEEEMGKILEEEMGEIVEEEMCEIVDERVEAQKERQQQMMQLGTPVPISHHAEKPALEKWSIGIQPFQHQPPAASTGFFKRMHQVVKSVRKNGK